MRKPDYSVVPENLNSTTNLDLGKQSVMMLGDSAVMRIYSLFGMIVQSMLGMGYSLVCDPRTDNLYNCIMWGMLEEGVIEHGVTAITYMESLEDAISNGKDIPEPSSTIDYLFRCFCIAVPEAVE